MIRIVGALLLVSTAAWAGEVSEQDKIDALKAGYVLNGNSMVGWGSIDLTTLYKKIPLSEPVATTAPIVKNEEEAKPVKERRRHRYHRRHRARR